MWLTDLCVKRSVFATMLNVALVLFGLLAYSKIGIDKYPNIDYPLVYVTVEYPNADPETVEQKLLKLMERYLTGVESVDHVQSSAQNGLASVLIQFELSRDSDLAAQDVRDKVEAMKGDSEYPSDAKTPVVQKYNINGEPIVVLALKTHGYDLGKMSLYVEDILKPMLERVEAVGDVDVSGTRDREIHILLNNSTLQSFNISPYYVLNSLKDQTGDFIGGKLENDYFYMALKTTGMPKTAEEVAKIAIPLPSGQTIKVEDFAYVSDTLEYETNYAYVKDQQSIVLQLNKRSGGSEVALANDLKSRLPSIRETLPKGTTLEILQDNSLYIKGSVYDVLIDLMIGALLAVVAVLIFLQNWTVTFITLCAIPSAVIGTVAAIYGLGFSLNVMTTLGLTLSIGLLVDDAIVVIENIIRHKAMGKTGFQAAIDSASEIGIAVFAISLSVVAVFLPVAFMDGVLGKFFYSFGLTVCIAVTLSFFVSFSLTPMMTSKLLNNDDKKPLGHSLFKLFDKIIEQTTSLYRSLLRVSLNNRFIVVFIGLGFFVLSLYLLKFVALTFFPREDQSRLAIDFQMPPDVSIGFLKSESMKILEEVKKYPEVRNVALVLGDDKTENPRNSTIFVYLVPPHKRKLSQDDFSKKLRNDLKPKFFGPQVSLSINPPSSDGGKPQPIQVTLTSVNPDNLEKYSSEIVSYLENDIPFVEDVTVDDSPLIQQGYIRSNSSLASDIFVNTKDIANSVQNLFTAKGVEVGELEDEKNDRYKIRMKILPEYAQDTNDIIGLYIQNKNNNFVPMENVSLLEILQKPQKIVRYNSQRSVSIYANYTGKNLGAALKKINHKIQERPKDINSEYGSQTKLLNEAIVSMSIAAFLASFLVYIILCAQFESYRSPFAIMMSVPLSFSGAFGALLLTDTELSIYAMIGMILLMGLATKNSILLIDFTLKRIREDNMTTKEALLDACPIRLRPILMTTFAMVFAMLPIALGTGDGGSARAPLAIAVIGGLLSSTLLTLVVVPCVFSLIQRDKRDA